MESDEQKVMRKTNYSVLSTIYSPLKKVGGQDTAKAVLYV
jgi:hypothetical protein